MITDRYDLKLDAVNQWCLQKLLRIKRYHHVWNDNWDGQPTNHTFQLLSKHSVSPCSVILHKCQMKPTTRYLNSFPLGELETTRMPLILCEWRLSIET